MTTTLASTPAPGQRRLIGGMAAAQIDAARSGDGPRVRVQLVGVGDEPAVRASLTRAWRLAGQPIIVVTTPGMGPVGRIAADWAAEHAVAGISLEVRYTPASWLPQCVEVSAAGPVPWCGCAEPPCLRCVPAAVDGPPSCAGCSSPLCPDHQQVVQPGEVR